MKKDFSEKISFSSPRSEAGKEATSSTSSREIHLSITGEAHSDWQLKLEEINEKNINTAAVFLERFEKEERDLLCAALLKSSIKYVPLVHLRHDAGKEDLEFFLSNFKTNHFNIHEDHFNFLEQWAGYFDKLYLEMNYDNLIPESVAIEKIGGFCVDLSHLRAAFDRGIIDDDYIVEKKNSARFVCNHLNGYSPLQKWDLHFINNLSDFDYLKTLPKYVFGDIIALEVDNSISDQIKFRDYLIGFLNNYFNE